MPKPIARRRGLPLEDIQVRTLLQRVLDLLEKYRTWVVLGGAAVLLAAAGFGLNSYLRDRRAGAAAAAMAKLRPQLSNPEAAAEALQGLEQFLKAHAGTDAALEAELFQAHLLYQTGKYEEALKAYQGLAANPRVHREAGLRALVTESLSYCQEALGKWGEAANTLKPLLEQTGETYRGEMLRRYAMLSEQAGQSAEARQAWEQLLQRPPVPALVPYLKEKLAATESKPAPPPAPKP